MKKHHLPAGLWLVARQLSVAGNTNTEVTGLRPGVYFIKIADLLGKGKAWVGKVVIID